MAVTFTRMEAGMLLEAIRETIERDGLWEAADFETISGKLHQIEREDTEAGAEANQLSASGTTDDAAEASTQTHGPASRTIFARLIPGGGA